MDVAVINTADQGGGAETCARMLRDGLARRGHDATLWAGRRRGTDTRTRVIPGSDLGEPRARRFAEKGFFGLGLATDSFCGSSDISSVDIIHLHNLHGHYFSIVDVPKLAERAPLVWTLHDHFPFTGGCAFPFDCGRWLDACGSCPGLGRYPIVTPYDRTRRMLSIKRKVFRDLPVAIVTPSRHLGQAARRSGMFQRAAFRVIPYGVDVAAFRPGREQARAALGLEREEPVVALVAQGLDDPRKGTDHAIAALGSAVGRRVTVLLVGANDEKVVGRIANSHGVRPFGYVDGRDELAQVYAAADVFLFPSLAENFPCVVQESMACGTPVVAFDIDGVNEQIRDGETGFLAPAGDAPALGRALIEALRHPERLREMGQRARANAVEHWRVQQFLDHHENLYEEVRVAWSGEGGPAGRAGVVL